MTKGRNHIRIKDLPQSLRPREKLHALGVDNLSSAELIALLLGTGTKKYNAITLSERIIKQFSLTKLADLKLTDLTKIDGIGLSKATSILAALELGKRVFVQPSLHKNIIQTTADALNQVREYTNKKQEHIIALYLNARHELLDKQVIAIGKLNSALIEPKEVLTHALLAPTHSFIIIHNHPSGDPTPSEDDIKFTLKLQQAAQIVGIEMLDHLIITENSYFSFREQE